MRLIGHQPIFSYFKTLEHAEMPAHAFLFAGPQRAGKKFFAFWLIKYWLCEGGQMNSLFGGDSSEAEAKPCLTCHTCRSIEALSHPDVHYLEKPEEKHVIPIDEIRQLISKAYRSPSQGKSKYLIIDNAHLLSNEAANAFLKTLEEPPRSVKIFLVTHQPYALPKTIFSRCQLIEFSRITDPGDVKEPSLWEKSEGLPGLYHSFLEIPATLEEREVELERFREIISSSKGKRLKLIEQHYFKKRTAHAEQKAAWNDRLTYWKLYLAECLAESIAQNSSQMNFSEQNLVRQIDRLTEIQNQMRFSLNLRANIEEFALAL